MLVAQIYMRLKSNEVYRTNANIVMAESEDRIRDYCREYQKVVDEWVYPHNVFYEILEVVDEWVYPHNVLYEILKVEKLD